jgi:hypothetical protein
VLLPLSGHSPAVPQPTQLGGELTILVDDALSADSGPLSIDSISPPSDPSRKSCLLAVVDVRIWISTCALKQRFTLKKRPMVGHQSCAVTLVGRLR